MRSSKLKSIIIKDTSDNSFDTFSAQSPSNEQATRSHSGTLVENIELSKIKTNKNQPRLQFEDAAILELSKNIDTYGLMQPIVVEREEDGTYSIISGERRFRAFALLKKERIPAIIREINNNKKESILLALSENIQRQNLSPLELSISYKNISDKFGIKTYKELADLLGKTESHVKLIMPLNKLSEKINSYLNTNKDATIDIKWLAVLANIKSHIDQESLFFQIQREKLNRDEAIELIRKHKQEKSNKETVKQFTDYVKQKNTKTKFSFFIDKTKLPKKFHKVISNIEKEIANLEKEMKEYLTS